MAILTIIEGGDKGRSVPLPQDREFVIGRDPGAELTIASKSASRRHCRILFKGGTFRIRDLDSSNGTLVNGKKVREVALKTGDVIEVAHVKLAFGLEEARPVIAEEGTEAFVPKEVGGYLIQERVGGSRLGLVYRAWQKGTGKLALVRLLPPAMVGKEKIVKRFARLTEAGTELNHPNVVQTLGAGEENGIHYIVSEFVEGKSLQQTLDEMGDGVPLDAKLVVDVLLQIAKALEHAFKHNIVHRDIKPGNIIVNKDGHAKLDNLWLAKRVEGPYSAYDLSVAGKPAGSLAYMPPEQVVDAKNVDCRADIYSLGATAYRCLTGRLPLKGETLKATVDKIKYEDPQPVRDLNKDVPASVAKVVARAMAKVPGQRYQTPTELVVELGLARKYQVK